MLSRQMHLNACQMTTRSFLIRLVKALFTSVGLLIDLRLAILNASWKGQTKQIEKETCIKLRTGKRELHQRLGYILDLHNYLVYAGLFTD